MSGGGCDDARTMTRASPATKLRPFLSLVTLAPWGQTSSSSRRSLSRGPSTGSPSLLCGARSSRMQATAPSKYSASAAPPSCAAAAATML